MKHGILLWCLNEIDALPTVCQQLNQVLESKKNDYIVLFVDGNSIDGSKELIQQSGFWVHSQNQKGMRSAIEEGVKLLLDLKVDSITFAQPDGNCDLTKLPKIIEPFSKEGEQLIIASRYKPPAKSFDDNFVSKIGNWYFSKLISFVSRHNYYDSMVGYRTFSSTLVERMGLIKNEKFWKVEKLLNTSLGWDPLISVLAPLLNVKIQEIPIDEPARIGGIVKKQTIRWGLAYSIQIFQVFFQKKKYRSQKFNF